MVDRKLEPILDSLKNSVVRYIDIDVKKDEISLNLEKDESATQEVNIRFEGVTTFYFIDESDEDKGASKINNSGLDSISYHQDGLGEFSAHTQDLDEVSFQLISLPNFALAMDQSSFYIEANSIDINGNRFNVTNPNN